MITLAMLVLVTYNIPAGDAPHTILQWSKVSHLQVMYGYRLVAPLHICALIGSHEPLQGLRQMLRYSRLIVRATNSHTFVVKEDQWYCHPEWGAQAPLPPCVPLPLTIRVEGCHE